MDWNRYRAVVFDFDMTLADTEKVIVRLLNDTSEHFGYGRKPYDYTAKIIGNSHETMLSYVTGEKNQEKVLEMRVYYRHISHVYMPELTTFFPDVREALEELKGMGLKLGVLSLKQRDLLLCSLEKYELAQFFDNVTGCEEMPVLKPAPEALWYVQEQLSVKKDELLYVGDSLVDQKTAGSAGVDFGAMLLGQTTRQEFESNGGAKAYFKSWEEI
jgi:phosphoglycolate phosphatase